MLHPKAVKKAISQSLDEIVASCLEPCINTRCPSAATLAQRLRKWRDAADTPAEPKVTIFPMQELDNLGLLDRSLKLYENIFSDRRQLVSSEDLRTWLKNSENADINGDPWREYWAVLHNHDDVGGFANVSLHMKWPWCFGGYLAVCKFWQSQSRHWSRQVLIALREHVRKAKPDLKGMVIEVQPFDMAVLVSAANLRTVKGEANEAQVIESFDNLRKIFELQSLGFHVASGEVGYPLEYRQPSLRDALADEHGCDLVLMVMPFDRLEPNISLKAVLNFVYDDIYGHCYTEPGPTFIEGYAENLQRLKERIRKKAIGFHFSPMSLYTQLKAEHAVQDKFETIQDVMISVREILLRDGLIGSDVDLWF